MSTKIHTLTAFEILDSRGNPTIKTVITNETGDSGWASIPSGASTGSHEAAELRDNDDRYNGMGVAEAVRIVNEVIALKIRGHDAYKLPELDKLLIELDGTENKSHLGANSILSVSLAAARLVAKAQKKELFAILNEYYFPNIKTTLPRPLANVLNGGAHANNSIDLQEFMIVPLSGDTFAKSYQMISEVYYALRKLLVKKKFSTTVGDEGGFAPQLSKNSKALDLIMNAITHTSYKPEVDIALALDAAANELYVKGQYQLTNEQRHLDSCSFAQYFEKLCKSYPIVSIEDPFFEDDWDGFIHFTKDLGKEIQIVGDDLFVTNHTRLHRGIEQNAANSILIKPNQIGTLLETVDAIKVAFEAELSVIISHRSGETVDPFIADLAVASGCGQIKAGAPARGERTAKYNRLVEIERFHPDIPLASFPYHGCKL